MGFSVAYWWIKSWKQWNSSHLGVQAEKRRPPYPSAQLYFRSSKVLCSPGSPVRRKRAGPEGSCFPCISRPDGHHHHSAERGRGQDASAVFWRFLGPVPTQRGGRLTQQPHLYTTLAHMETLACICRTWTATLVTDWRLHSTVLPTRLMLIKVCPQHDSQTCEHNPTAKYYSLCVGSYVWPFYFYYLRKIFTLLSKH